MMIEKKYKRLKANVKQPHSSFVLMSSELKQNIGSVMCSENFKAILSLDVCTMNFGIVAFNEAEKYNLLFIYSYLSKKNPSWLE